MKGYCTQGYCTRALCFVVLISLFWIPSAWAKTPNRSSAKQTIVYEVRNGDSLSKIAKQYDTKVSDIVRWNNLANEHQIRKGQRLKIRVPKSKATAYKNSAPAKSDVIVQNIEYTVVRGDSLSKIARKTGVSIDELKKNNRNLRKNPDKLRVGQKIVLRVKRFEQTGVSRGLANRGSLSGGVKLASGPGYIVRHPERAYGTALSVGNIMDAMKHYHKKYPKGPRFAVGDLSKKNGGYLKPHLSHQSGRDVDISYVNKNNKEFVGFARMNRNNFDVPKNWTLIEAFLNSKQVQYIFVDYELQALLYQHALENGYSKERLKTIIQYPNGKQSYHAIIRHSKGHADHMHVRFICAKTDVNCH